MIKKIFFVILVFTLALSACSPAIPVDDSSQDMEGTADAQTAQVVPTSTITPQPNLYSLESLRNRTYGEGEFNVEYMWERQPDFVRYKVNYLSDGLNIHGFVNIPEGNGPFPVVIALHGYIPAYRYETRDYSTRYADSIARKGYIVLHPNMRNFPPSDSAPRERDYLGGYTIDVLNMLAYVREAAGQSGSIFENADLSRIGIWGHSLGGGTALRAVSVEKDIKAAVIYAGVSQRYNNNGLDIFDYRSSDAAFSVHHGTEDETISVAWSRRLCEQLKDAGRPVDCFYYEGQPHTLYSQGDADPLFIKRTIEFFDELLKNN